MDAQLSPTFEPLDSLPSTKVQASCVVIATGWCSFETGGVLCPSHSLAVPSVSGAGPSFDRDCWPVNPYIAFLSLLCALCRCRKNGTERKSRGRCCGSDVTAAGQKGPRQDWGVRCLGISPRVETQLSVRVIRSCCQVMLLQTETTGVQV